MKLIVGLGNPGRHHVMNRHNLGFLIVEAWALLKQAEIRKEEFQSLVARVKVGDQDVLVMKPQTFMNRSGEAISSAMKFFKIAIEDVIVLHDELDIAPQTYRIKRGGGHGGHNGLKSIMPLGENFLRFRLGIGRPSHPEMAVADYVLGNLTPEEMNFWEKEMTKLAEAIDLCLLGKVEQAMTRFNRKS